MKPVAAVALFLSVALATPSAARPRVDTILLTNGDQVTGEIVRLEAATLTVRTASLGTVEIDWPDVRGLVSPQLFEVERTDGARFVGRLVADERSGVLVIEADEPEPVEMSFDRVVGIDQRGSNLWTSRRGYVDLGWNFAQAESDTNLSLEAELVLHGRWFRWVSSLSASFSDDANNDQRQREAVQSRLEVPAGRHFLYLGSARHERNDDLGLVGRESITGVFAWLPLNGPRGRILLGPGASESRENYDEREQSSSLLSGALLFAAEYHRFGRFGTRAELSVLWLPVLSGPDRDRVEVNAALRQKLGSDFTISVSPYYSYDSQPPASGAASEDWGWVTTVGLQF